MVSYRKGPAVVELGNRDQAPRRPRHPGNGKAAVAPRPLVERPWVAQDGEVVDCYYQGNAAAYRASEGQDEAYPGDSRDSNAERRCRSRNRVCIASFGCSCALLNSGKTG